MPMATIHKVGQGELYHIHFLDQGGVDPGYGQGRPGGDHISNRPPVSGNRPDQGLPGTKPGGIPDNELPDTPPPNLAPGWTLVLIRGPEGKWNYAAIAPGSPPPRPLPPGPPDVGPGQPNRPDNALPGGPPATGPGSPGGIPHPGGGPLPPQVGGGPMPGGPPPVAGQPLPPTAQPR